MIYNGRRLHERGRTLVSHNNARARDGMARIVPVSCTRLINSLVGECCRHTSRESCAQQGTTQRAVILECHAIEHHNCQNQVRPPCAHKLGTRNHGRHSNGKVDKSMRRSKYRTNDYVYSTSPVLYMCAHRVVRHVHASFVSDIPRSRMNCVTLGKCDIQCLCDAANLQAAMFYS